MSGTEACAKIACLAASIGVWGAPRSPQQAGVAQLVEQLIRNQQVRGSSPRAGSNSYNDLQWSMTALIPV